MTAGQARSTDHVARAVAKLPIQFRTKPFIRALVEIRARKWQALEDAAWEVLDAQTIETAIGVGLDAIGVLVGRGRNDATDALYRIALRAQIRINRAQGNARDTLEVGNLSTLGNTFQPRTYPPASYVVTMVEPVIVAGEVAPLAENLRQVRALGVRGFLSVGFTGPGAARYVATGAASSAVQNRYSWTGDDQLGGRYHHVRTL